MNRVCIVAGTRPNLIKVSPLVCAAKEVGIDISLVDTMQHYDRGMRDVFYEELELPEPVPCIPDNTECVIVIGDTNSTVCGALMACERGIPLAHVEAGCRCFDKTLPEEVNRIMVDSLSEYCFCATIDCKLNLENSCNNIWTGDVLYDMFLKHAPERDERDFILVTIHRKGNTKDDVIVKEVLTMAAKEAPVIFPVHPRTRPLLDGWKIKDVVTTDPVSYKGMLNLLSKAKKVITDSGGLQREAYWMGVPFQLERTSNSWPETMSPGNDDQFGDGRAAYKIMEILADE